MLLQLTTVTGYNGRHGVFATDQVAAIALGGSVADALVLPNATIACAQSTWSCGEFGRACIARQEACRAAGAPDLLQGGCPADGKGFELGERLRFCTLSLPPPLQCAGRGASTDLPPRPLPIAGFTFAQPGGEQGSAASAVSLPEQVYQAGLIQERVVRHSLLLVQSALLQGRQPAQPWGWSAPAAAQHAWVSGPTHQPPVSAPSAAGDLLAAAAKR